MPCSKDNGEEREVVNSQLQTYNYTNAINLLRNQIDTK